MLSNPARVMKAQLKVINLEDGKNRPMKDISIGGIVLLDRAELGAEEEEQVSAGDVALEHFNIFSIFRLLSLWWSTRELPPAQRRKERNLLLLNLSSGLRINKIKYLNQSRYLRGQL